MVFCRGCGKEIHDSASACPHCGADQFNSNAGRQGSKWMAITSLVLGILTFLTAMGIMVEGGNADEVLGVGLFGVISVVLAVISLVQKHWGKALSIAGIALSSVSLLALIGA
tara:strand:+ start:12622 stop:12957 length:336 start_codon:yes stop_codon:yes gene_type:complete